MKRASGGFPKDVAESLSAFANSSGGLLILGLDESKRFEPAEIDAKKLASDLASTCADQLEPPIRADIDICIVDGQPVVVASIEELPADQKPCFVKRRGMNSGSYVRTHDGDRVLTTYEVHILFSAKGQPREDAAIVPAASRRDLNDGLVRSLVERLRRTRGPVFTRSTDEEILNLVGVVSEVGPDAQVSLGGLLALGTYPQRFFPQLDLTFVAYATINGAPLDDGTRFLDNQTIDGPIPIVVDETMSAIRRNLSRRSVIGGLGRVDRWEYPEEALREFVANALMHRDYHPLAHGTQVRVELYPDRIEISSPGGLFGPIAPEDLLAETVTSSRNALLAKLLEDVEIPGTQRTVCENRGSGLLAAADALRRAGIEPPQIRDSIREFRVMIRNHGLLDEQVLAWLATVDTSGLNDRQRLALAYLRRNDKITNSQYRTLTGVDAQTATKELTALSTRGLVSKDGDKRGTSWRASEKAAQWIRPQLPLEGLEPPPKGKRREEIRHLLASGPKSTAELAAFAGVGKEAIRHWLRRMELAGEVRPTAGTRSNRNNKWQLVGGPGTETS